MDTGDRFESTEGVYIELLIAEQRFTTVWITENG